MTVIDIHAHVYPDKIATKAVQAVGDFYQINMHGNGSPASLFELNKGTPITHSVIHSVATTPKQVPSICHFIADACKQFPTFIGFMPMHQDTVDPTAEIESAIKLGLCGIKIHPDIQQVNMDDPRLMRVYEIAERKGLPLIIHTGDYRYDYSHPRRMQHILHEFPRLIVNAAHFGGWSVPDLAVEYLQNERCFMDASSSFAFTGKQRAKELIEIYGADRILFGSDFPMWNPQEEYEFLISLGLSKLDVEKITHTNAERFLGMNIG